MPKKRERARLDGLATGHGLQGMLEVKDHLAVDTFFRFVALSTDRSIEFEGSCDLTPLSVQYVNSVNKMLVDQREVQWVERELSKLWSEIEEFKRVVQTVFSAALHVCVVRFKITSFGASTRRFGEILKHFIYIQSAF